MWHSLIRSPSDTWSQSTPPPTKSNAVLKLWPSSCRDTSFLGHLGHSFGCFMCFNVPTFWCATRKSMWISLHSLEWRVRLVSLSAPLWFLRHFVLVYFIFTCNCVLSLLNSKGKSYSCPDSDSDIPFQGPVHNPTLSSLVLYFHTMTWPLLVWQQKPDVFLSMWSKGTLKSRYLNSKRKLLVLPERQIKCLALFKRV